MISFTEKNRKRIFCFFQKKKPYILNDPRIYIYIYIGVCVCVCVCVRARVCVCMCVGVRCQCISAWFSCFDFVELISYAFNCQRCEVLRISPNFDSASNCPIIMVNLAAHCLLLSQWNHSVEINSGHFSVKLVSCQTSIIHVKFSYPSTLLSIRICWKHKLCSTWITFINESLLSE